MKKSMFNIWFRDYTGEEPVDETKEIPGYIFTYDGLKLGVSNYYISNGKPKRSYKWEITELKTGALLGVHATTKEAAIEKLKNFNRWEGIKKAINDFDGINRNPEIV